jgi:hypothetical protein
LSPSELICPYASLRAIWRGDDIAAVEADML